MANEEYLFEMRHSAPAHFWAKANNAWFAASMLWQTRGESACEEIAKQCGYSGSTSLALFEAYLREAAISLELITKATLASKASLSHLEPASTRVPPTHDLPLLWQKAGLPVLSRDDKYRLLRFKSILIWSGRYATPKSVEAWIAENDALKVLIPPAESGKLANRNPIGCGWPEFDRLYQLALAEYAKTESHRQGL